MKLRIRTITLTFIILLLSQANGDPCYTYLDSIYMEDTYSQDDIYKIYSGDIELPMFQFGGYGFRAADVMAFKTVEFNKIPYLSTTNSKDIRYNDKIEPYNPIVRAKALEIASRAPGSYSIGQVCEIYNYVNSGWRYINDPSSRGDYINSASESIEIGERAGCAGVGDCEDFAVLMASLIEAIGGKTRIIHTTRHAYAEVYIGNEQQGNDNIANILTWVRDNYQISGKECLLIFFHKNLNTSDRWLSLEGLAGSIHPGGTMIDGDVSWIAWASEGSKAPHVPGSQTTVITTTKETPQKTVHPTYGDVSVTIRSWDMRGYEVYLNGYYVGTDGQGSDALDGIFKLNVVGGQEHTISVWDGEWFYGKPRFYELNTTYILKVERVTPLVYYGEAL